MHGKKSIPLVAAIALLLASMTGNASAGSKFMPTGGPTSQPVGHYEFCQRVPDECRQKSRRVSAVAMTRELWAKMIEINNAINVAVMPTSDMERWGVEEFWSYPDIYGDCEDYVLEKRRLLIDAGVPASNLLITVVRQKNGDGHAVLTVSTSMGDFVLDNLDGRILPWSETKYQYLKRQSAENAARWVSVDDGRAVAVSTVSASR